MAPAIKELSRWLDANSEYGVAPDWSDVVKHSVSTTPPARRNLFYNNSIICSVICVLFILMFFPPAGFPP